MPPTQPDAAEFRAMMGAFPTGVAVVTTFDTEGRPRGFTSNAVCSVSLDPPLLLVCVDKRTQTLPVLEQTRRFVVNFLRAGCADISRKFASKDPDKFDGITWRPASNGMPLLYAHALAHVECATERQIDAGDHVIFLGRAEGGSEPVSGGLPLMYFDRTYSAWPGGDSTRNGHGHVGTNHYSRVERTAALSVTPRLG